MYVYKDYLDAIVRHYKERKSKSDLPHRLLQPRPSKIRDECASVYKSRFVNRDLNMLVTFFGVSDETVLLRTIENFDIDKFKPLVNFLRGGTKDTDDKNIELLGWLLDFQKRPFDAKFDYEFDKKTSTEGDIKDIREVITAGDVNDNVSGSPELEGTTIQPDRKSSRSANNINKSFRKKTWKLMAGVVILLGIGGIIYFSNRRNKAIGIVAPGQKECMVWADDHYEGVSCDSPGRVGLVLPLDKRRMNNLYRIEKPDTIREKHIGKLWYQKRGTDSLDYFTAGGRDPIDPNRDLKRLTWHVFNKHLRKKGQ